MIFFNWNKVQKHCNWSQNRLLNIMYYITYKNTNKVYKDKYKDFMSVDWRGDSFLLNPEEIFENRKNLRDEEIIEYIGYARHRSYGDVELQGKKSLDLIFCRDKKDKIQQNSLLRIVDGQIHFYFEENPTDRERIFTWH